MHEVEHIDPKRERAQQVLGSIFDLVGARVLVTGAAGGLGFTMAEILAECGATVTLADVDVARLERSARKLTDRGLAARSFVVDVTVESSVQAVFDDIVERDGGLDVVIANAGIAAVPGFRADGGQTLDTVERSDWDKVLAVNLSGVMFTMRAAAAVMKRQRAGRIVVIASNAGLRPEPMVCYGYAASKAAVIHLVRQAALELAPSGILVNAICPGPFYGTLIGGGVTEHPTEELKAAWATLIPLGRMADPDELRGLVVLLASGASSFMTGAAYMVDGGSLVQA
jgi:NAD(P)-dependent dehydrogenase (short-subunit alcohol dehydrogenase family)